jgi:DNA mismatch endonuclease (patch repair protein)
MPDVMTPQQRHECMSHIRSKDTKPEQLVRQALWHNGFRYRLHDKRLPGKPDIVLPKYHTVIFINGCFWHGHKGCRYYVIPKTNSSFWLDKIESNKARDARDISVLNEAGWRVMTIWECELKKPVLERTISSLLQVILEG